MSSQVVTANTEAAILARVIESVPSTITPDAYIFVRVVFASLKWA